MSFRRRITKRFKPPGGVLPPERPCLICGKRFTPDRQSRKEQKCCSRECVKEAKRRSLIAASNAKGPEPLRVQEKTCPACGGAVVRRGGTAKYCFDCMAKRLEERRGPSRYVKKGCSPRVTVSVDASLAINEKEKLAHRMRYTENKPLSEIDAALGMKRGYSQYLFRRMLKRLKGADVQSAPTPPRDT